MKNIIIFAIALTGLLFSCEKSPFCEQEPPIDWLTQDCEYEDLDIFLEDDPIDSVWCDGRWVYYKNVTKTILEPLVVDPVCGYYIGGVVQYHFGESPFCTIDYSLGNGRASKVTYVVYNSGAPCENERQGCYFQQPCNPADNDN